MNIKKIHYLSGLIIIVFIGLHLANHIIGTVGAERHIEMMNTLRLFYRNIFIETILIASVIVQIFSGFKLFLLNRKVAVSNFEKLQVWTGLYMAIFLIIHVSAVFIGRSILHLDTNFYFGVAGLNTFPYSLFFIPYYALAIISFFGHIASIHNKKMKNDFIGLTVHKQSTLILTFGFIITLIIFYGVTNHFQGVVIPKEYGVLIGK